MDRILIVRLVAIWAITCINAVPIRAQQPLPLDVPEVATVRAQLLTNPRIVAADLRVRAAEARVSSARALRAPASLYFDAEEIATSDPGQANISAGLEYEFTPARERRAETSIASAELAAAIATRDGLRLRLESELVRSFLEGVVHQRIATRLAQEDSLLQRAEATLNARFSVGQARYVDVIRLRTERLRVQADLLDATTEISRALLAMQSLIGRNVSPSELSAVTLHLPDTRVVIDTTIVRSPAFRLAVAEQERARASLLTAAARGTTRFAAQLGVQRFLEEGNSTIGPTFGGSISLPFTNRRMVRSAVEAARLDTAAVALQSSSLARVLRSEIGAALAQIDAIARRISGVDQQLINAAREEREAALSAYANGELSLVELLDFERSLSRAEIQLLQSYDTAIDAWHRASQSLAGGGLDGDTQ
jgi:cobalt-zinc-cadmium efflux system outer membrane protein